jgi:hypothetical protein
MRSMTIVHSRTGLALASVLVGLLAWPGTGQAQTVSGQATAVRAIVLGTVTTLADTGTLSDPSDPLGTGQPTGSVPGLLTGETLHAATMGWTDQVASEASLANLGMTVAGTGISVALVLSRAIAVSGGSGTGLSSIDGLSIGGAPVIPTGAPNQTISFPGLRVVLNEQISSADGITVNALHVRTLDGLTDVVIGSAKAGLASSGSPSPLPPLPPLF